MAEYAALIVAIATVASVGVGTYAAVAQSEAQADLQESVAKQKEQEAAIARDTAEFNERQHRRRLAFLLGQQRAGFAAAGVDPFGKSPLAAELDLVTQGELEALAIRREGAIQSSERRFEANVARFYRNAAKQQIPIQIAGGVVGALAGGTSAYTTTSYYRRPRSQATVGQQLYGYP